MFDKRLSVSEKQSLIGVVTALSAVEGKLRETGVNDETIAYVSQVAQVTKYWKPASSWNNSDYAMLLYTDPKLPSVYLL